MNGPLCFSVKYFEENKLVLLITFCASKGISRLEKYSLYYKYLRCVTVLRGRNFFEYLSRVKANYLQFPTYENVSAVSVIVPRVKNIFEVSGVMLACNEN
jgi:hypothetical protein